MDNKIKISIVFPVILIIILILIANSIHFKGKFSEIEMQTLKFKPSGIMLKQRESAQVSADLKSPIDFTHVGSQGLFPTVALDTLAPQAGGGLSLIVISGKSRMAIIKGVVVKEGDSIDGVKIVRIELDRVLLKDKTTQWLYMEKIK
ncbi:MAG: hypothetical protein Q8N09_05390 [Thermodesulfovibrionia bacterium]|nr:hypothetical protein [Thermodesulfovibrionia bacterium]